jgi:hypothetical protein
MTKRYQFTETEIKSQAEFWAAGRYVAHRPHDSIMQRRSEGPDQWRVVP